MTEDKIWFDGKFLYAGERRFGNVKPTDIGIDFNEAEDKDLGTGRIYRNRRLRVLFESGWQLSVVWGYGTYSSNYHADDKPEHVWRDFLTNEWTEEPTLVEVAILDVSDEIIGDDVHAWVDADELARLIDYAMTWPSDPEFKPTMQWRNENSNV